MADDQILQRFTAAAIRVVQYAKQEARARPGNSVGTEHLLLGLTREQGTIATQVLERLGLSHGRVQAEVERLAGPEQSASASQRWSAEARATLELAVEVATEWNARLARANHLDTEHLLLALTRQPESTAARVMRALGAEPERVVQGVERTLGAPPSVPMKELVSATPAAGYSPPLRLVDVTTRYGYDPRAGISTTPEQVKQAAPRWGVVQAYTWCWNAVLFDYAAGNRETLELCARDPFFRPVAVLSPMAHHGLAAAEPAKSRGFAYARLFPDQHGYAVDGWACRDLLAECGRVGLPVMLPVQESGAANLQRALQGLRGTFLLTRVRYGVLGEVLAMAGRLPNVYVDISGVNTPDGIALLAEAFGPERLLFGSDYPLLEVGCAALLLGGSGLPGDQMEAIGSGNARSLLEVGR